MSGRSLKNYDKYLQKLELYAKAIKFKILYVKYDGDGAYIPSKRLIKIDEDLSESDIIGTLLHELGHVADSHSFLSNGASNNLEKAYTATYKKKNPTNKQIKLVLECEKRAWKEAETIAKLLKIKLGKWYYKGKQEALNSYRK